MGGQGVLDLAGTDPLAGHLERVVRAAEQEPLAVLVHPRPVAVVPHAGKAAEIGVEVALLVVEETPGHRRGGLPADEVPRRAPRRGKALVRVHRRVHAEPGTAERAGPEAVEGSGRQVAADDLRAPRDIHDGAAPSPHLLEVPEIARLVPDFARRAEHPKPGKVVGRRPPSAGRPNQLADERRGHAQGHHAELFADLPHAVACRVVGGPVEEHDGRAVEQAADDFPRPHHPSDVGQPEERLAGPRVEGIADLLSHLREAAAVRVHRPLRAAGRPAGVEDEARVLGPGLLAGEPRPAPFQERLPVPRVRPHDPPDRWHACRGGRGDGAGVGGPSAPDQRPRRKQGLGPAGVQPLAQGLLAIAAEDGDGARADLHRGKERHDRGHLHGGVEGHRVAAPDADPAQCRGAAIHHAGELAEGHPARIPGSAGVGLAVQGRLMAVAVPHVAVDAVVGNVHQAVRKPPGVGQSARVVAHARVFPEPLDPHVSERRVPEPGRVGDRAAAQLGDRCDAVRRHEAGDVGVARPRMVAGPPDWSGSVQASSTQTAIPSPPPMQMAATPRRAPRSRIVWSSVTRMRAPLAPIGWPSAIAPPRTFILS